MLSLKKILDEGRPATTFHKVDDIKYEVFIDVMKQFLKQHNIPFRLEDKDSNQPIIVVYNNKIKLSSDNIFFQVIDNKNKVKVYDKNINTFKEKLLKYLGKK